MLTARRFVTAVRLFWSSSAPIEIGCAKYCTPYFITTFPSPSFRCHSIFFIYARLIRTLIKIKNLNPDQLC
jgi:hypothetical protein